ncbi:MAG: hypothetical protein GY696_17610 [Gammaproteobacteria bacterium]|nr:hypothetical protein [Gammaproteobacteria bacterium]
MTQTVCAVIDGGGAVLVVGDDGKISSKMTYSNYVKSAYYYHYLKNHDGYCCFDDQN